MVQHVGERRGGMREKEETKEMRREREMRRASEREGESGWWWTVDPTSTDSAYWAPFVPPGSPTLDPQSITITE